MRRARDKLLKELLNNEKEELGSLKNIGLQDTRSAKTPEQFPSKDWNPDTPRKIEPTGKAVTLSDL